MKKRAKIKWDSEVCQWKLHYSDGFIEHHTGSLEEAHYDLTEWERRNFRQEVSG